MTTFEKTASIIIEKLSEQGVVAYVWHVATTGSVYIRFNDNRIGSIRLGDHEGRDSLKYKFNVRSDAKFTGWAKDGNIWRYYCKQEEVDLLVDILVKRADQVKDWELKYKYGTPKHMKSKSTEDKLF